MAVLAKGEEAQSTESCTASSGQQTAAVFGAFTGLEYLYTSCLTEEYRLLDDGLSRSLGVCLSRHLSHLWEQQQGGAVSSEAGRRRCRSRGGSPPRAPIYEKGLQSGKHMECQGMAERLGCCSGTMKKKKEVSPAEMSVRPFADYEKRCQAAKLRRSGDTDCYSPPDSTTNDVVYLCICILILPNRSETTIDISTVM